MSKINAGIDLERQDRANPSLSQSISATNDEATQSLMRNAEDAGVDEESKNADGSDNTFRLNISEPNENDYRLNSNPTNSTSLISNSTASVISYCSSSIMMTVVNKFVLSGTHFNMNFLLLLIQSSVGVFCVLIVKKLRIITFRDFDIHDARKWFPISCCLIGVIYTGSKALQFLSIPVYTIFKNLTIILIAYGEVLWFGGMVTPLTLVSFGLMIFSSIIAAWSDISYRAATLPAQLPTFADMIAVSSQAASWNSGYLWMFLNCIVTATYALTMRNRIKATGFSDWDSMFYNNLLSVPVLMIASFLVEDWSRESLRLNFPENESRLLLTAMAFSGAVAVGISYTTAWCVRTTSSTTYSMVGALNKLPVAASGMLFFGDPVTFGSTGAVFLGFVAGLVYAIAKVNQSRRSNATNPGAK